MPTKIAEREYKFTPLGKYVVSAPGVCGGRPTFKGTRVEVANVIARLANGHTPSQIVECFEGRIPLVAIREGAVLADKALGRFPKRARSA